MLSNSQPADRVVHAIKSNRIIADSLQGVIFRFSSTTGAIDGQTLT